MVVREKIRPTFSALKNQWCRRKALFDFLSLHDGRPVYDLRKILSKRKDCRSCTARGHPAKSVVVLCESRAVAVLGGFECPHRMLIAHQYDPRAQDIFFGHHVAAEIAAACSSAILHVIDVVVIYFVEQPFFTEIVDRSAVIRVETFRPSETLDGTHLAPVLRQQPVWWKAVGGSRLAGPLLFAVVADVRFRFCLSPLVRLSSDRFLDDAQARDGKGRLTAQRRHGQ